MGNKLSTELDLQAKSKNSKDSNGFFIMVTYDPGLGYFEYVESHAVYTNNRKKIKEIGKEIPEPHPPSSNVIFKMEEPQIDFHFDDNTTVASLVRQLINAYVANTTVNDADRVRILYKWLASQNVRKTAYRLTANFQTVIFQLKKLKDKKNSYAALFSLLCSYAGIPCVIVKGYVKGSKYDVGETMSEKHVREWNAVLVDGEWRIVDVFWGALTDLRQTPDPYYLFPEPKDLIYSHFPENQQWQLIQSPISMKAFERQAFLKQRFFQMKMDILTNRDCQVEATDGEVEIIFQLDPNNAENQEFNCITSRFHTDKKLWVIEEPEKKDVQLDFVYKVRSHEDSDLGNDGDEEEDDAIQDPETYTVTAVSIKVRFPKVGDYKLEIIGADHIYIGPNKKKASDAVDFDWVAIYKVNVKTVPDWQVFFPRMEDIGWGPNPYLRQCGLGAASQQNGNFKCHPGSFEIKFKILLKAPTKDIKLRYSIQEIGPPVSSDSVSDGEIVKDDFTQNGDTLSIPVFLDLAPGKKRMEIKIMIFATLNTTDKGNVCNYLVTCEEDKGKFLEEQINEMTKELNNAIELRQVPELQRVLFMARQIRIHRNPHIRRLYREADDLRRKLQRLEESLKKIRTVDTQVILTLKSYNQAESKIMTVMKATFVILGSDNSIISSWDKMKQEITTISKNKTKSLIARIHQLDINKLTASTVKKAKEYLGDLQVEEMVGKSADVASFFKWVKSVIEAYEVNASVS